MKTVKTYSPKTKILSLILSLLIIFYLVPISVFAEGLDNDTTVSNSSMSVNEESNTYTPEIYEVIELREENAKHFRLEDGSYVAAQYKYPIHYTDENGQLTDIDNRLIDSGSEFSTNNSRVKFIKKITGNGNIFTLHDNNTKITMGLVGAEKKTEGVVTKTNNSDDAIESVIGKMTNLENLSSAIVYEDIIDGVDIEYIVHSMNIKENLIVKEKQDNYSYTFTLELNNLTATLTDNGSVYIASLDGETQYVIPAPIVYDANRTYAPENVSAYTLSATGNGKYELNVTVASDWMNDDERAFPVTIDPTIGVPHNYTVDLSVLSVSPNSNFEDSFNLNVSSEWRSYWKIPTAYLPTLPNTAHIWKAELKLFGGGIDSYVGAYEITSDWDETLTWNKTIGSSPQGAFGNELLDYKKLNSGEEWYTFDVTKAAEKWYDGENNYGVGLKLVDGTGTTKSATFYSYEYYDDYDDRFVEPCFYVYYSDISGLEDYYSLSSHSVAGIGSGSVNLASGNLTLISDLVSTTDYLMPMTVSAVYNSDMAGKDYNIANSFSAYTTSYMPRGYKLNIAETIIEISMQKENGSTTNYCILSDADGTNHYFYYLPAEGYVDDSAQGRTLIKLTTGEIVITYRDQSKKIFTKMATNPAGTTGGWVLSEITDSFGNSVEIDLDNSYRPTKVRLLPNENTTAIEMISFSYSGGKLYRVQNSNSLDYATFSYSSTYNSSTLSSTGQYLRKITYGNSNATSNYAVAQINYTSNGNISNVQNSISASKTVYNWNGNKVSLISEYGNGVLGQKVAYSYGKGYTDIRSTGNDEALGTADDIMNRYIYDIYGRTVSAYSGSVGFTEIYGATMGVYETTPVAKNSIKESTIVYDGKVDYISNDSSLNATLQGGVTKTEDTGCYKQTVFELSNPASVTYNADMQYIISGFGYSNSITQNEDARFSLSAKVYYYQGVGKPNEVVTHHFDFADVEDTWQFVSGKLDCKKENEASISYDVVKKIEIICNYYGQIDVDGATSYAYFKDVAFTNFADSDTDKYSYDGIGRLSSIVSRECSEYYEYDSKNRVTEIENTYNDFIEYIYTENESTGESIYYENHSKINSNGTATLVFANSYIYNKYGLLTNYVQLDSKILNVTDFLLSPMERMNTTYTYETTAGSKIFGALLSTTDSLGHTTTYEYDSSNGQLDRQYDNTSNTGYSYTYDNLGRLQLVTPFSATSDSESVSYSYNSSNYLSLISTESTSYSFTYDSFGNTSQVKAGNHTLATYEYYSNNGKLKKITYGNEFVEEYVYDSLEMLSEIWYTIDGTRTKVYSYTYNLDGTLDVVTDHLAGKNTKYQYDNRGRLETIKEKDISATNYTDVFEVCYDAENRISSQTSIISYTVNASVNSLLFTTSYAYNTKGRLSSETLEYLSANHKINYYFDDFGRLTSVNSNLGSFSNTKQYTYVSEGYDTSYLIGNYTSTVNGTATTYSYEYDSKGNITKIVSGNKEIRYVYDDLGQLLREDNGLLNETYVYTYDSAGNITNKKTYALTAASATPTSPVYTDTYSYGDSSWGDKLTSYNGSTITYDSIGNPIYYRSDELYEFEWEGRKLVSAEIGDEEYTTVTFTYNDDGLRTSKTVDGVTTTYYYNGDLLVAQEIDTLLMVFMYDASGSPIGFMYRYSSYAVNEWIIYWYEKNLQGDIVAIYDSEGTLCISYNYDAWGNCRTSYESGYITSVARLNPFRYRGYYYDDDLKLYYLQSRYYDPNTCRFINADSALYHSMLGYNMFAYCGNNPVNYYDPTGEYSEALNPSWTATIWLSLLALIDGPLPIGEILGVAIGTLIVADALRMAQSKASEKSEDKPQEPTEAVGEPEQNSGKDSPNTDSKSKTTKNPKDYVGAKNNKTANKWAQKFGYNGAEDLKREFVGGDGSKFNIFRDRSTGEIVLIAIKTADEIFTELFLN